MKFSILTRYLVIMLIGIIGIFGSDRVIHVEAISATCQQPPQNVSLTALSDAQLQLYGLPIHDVLNQDTAKWSRVLTHAKHRTCGKTSNTIISQQKHARLSPDQNLVSVSSPSTDIMNSKTSIWSGYEADGPRGFYRAASLEFYVPTVSGPPNSHASIWAGVGDGLTNPTVLVQAGVDSWINSTGQTIYTSWWEVVPGFAEQDLPIDGLKGGDQIYVDVESNYHSSNSNNFFIEDETNGSYNSYITPGSVHLSDSASAEYILERPYVNGTTLLANVNKPRNNLGIYNCMATTDTKTAGVGNWKYHLVTMWNASQQQLAAPGNLTPDGRNFLVYWYQDQ